MKIFIYVYISDPDSVFPYYFLSKHLRQTIQKFFYLSVFISYCCCNKLLKNSVT